MDDLTDLATGPVEATVPLRLVSPWAVEWERTAVVIRRPDPSHLILEPAFARRLPTTGAPHGGECS